MEHPISESLLTVPETGRVRGSDSDAVATINSMYEYTEPYYMTVVHVEVKKPSPL